MQPQCEAANYQSGASCFRRSTPIIVGIVVLASAGTAHAGVADCNRIIELAKLRNELVTDSKEFAQYQKNFCDDYQSFKSSGKAMSAGGSYGPISGSFGQSSSSVESVAKRYCQEDGSMKSSADAYRSYVEAIAPGAFDSYNNCIKLNNTNIEFNFPPAAIQANNATFVVSNTDTNQNAFDNIRYQTTPGINCNWDDPSGKDVVKLKSQSTATLNCSRASADQAGYVLMYATTLPNSAVTVAWDEYQGGAPMSVVKQLQAATADMTALKASLLDAVVAFNSSSCPAGWTPFVPAQGRFVRGIDPKGDKSVDPDGTRTPGNIQTDELKSHTHSHIQMVADNNVDGVDSVTKQSGDHHNQQKLTGATGGAETRPKNVALLYCQPV